MCEREIEWVCEGVNVCMPVCACDCSSLIHPPSSSFSNSLPSFHSLQANQVGKYWTSFSAILRNLQENFEDLGYGEAGALGYNSYDREENYVLDHDPEVGVMIMSGVQVQDFEVGASSVCTLVQALVHSSVLESSR